MPRRRKLTVPSGAPPLATPEELTLYPSRRKWALILLGSLLFCAATPLVIPRNPFIGWLGLVFFGICATISLLLVLFPDVSYLRLTQDGFVQQSLFRSHLTRWQDVTHFGIAAISMTHTMVVYNYDPAYTAQKLGRQMSIDLTGWEAALPDTYGMDAQELANLMNEWKSRSAVRESGRE